jgi:hypothetical protein
MFKRLVMMVAAALLAANSAHASPQQIDAVYDLYRNGQKLGSVTENFTRSGNLYQIVSETRAVGPLKLFWPGTIRLESQGEVNENGLRPNSFRHARSDRPNKTASAALDWNKRSIRFQYKDEIRYENGLRDRSQDQLSQLYQFVFMPRLPTDYSLDVVSGKTRNDYRYRQRDGGKISVPAGQYPVQEFDRILAPGDDKAITVWVAPGRNNFPVQIRIVEDGVTLEQRLVRLTIKP